MITCSKSYRDIPLSHRQPNHNGRCSRLHGHSWSITLTFEADELDENGFVVDFGDLHFIEDWIDQHLDHATAVWENDPKLSELQSLEADGLIKLVLVPSASCEGIAQFLYHTFQSNGGGEDQGACTHPLHPFGRGHQELRHLPA
jgi:6-pyruvoyltetrahydropterin/6-carboxytetrahydropterin synthase